jgi:hypothetical protein
MVAELTALAAIPIEKLVAITVTNDKNTCSGSYCAAFVLFADGVKDAVRDDSNERYHEELFEDDRSIWDER